MKKKNSSIKKLVTHNGSFHSDDVFACAVLSIMLERKKQKFEIIRTRDEKIIKEGDYIFDVGGVYSPTKNRFDHHQKGGAGKRTNGIEYASIGLVWKKFGKEIAGSSEIASLIDEKICAPVDANDNGFDLVKNKHKIIPFTIQHLFGVMRPTWKEKTSMNDRMFLRCVSMAKEILLREITQLKDGIEASRAVIKAYKNSSNKKIVILDKNYPCEYTLSKFSTPLFVVYPRDMDGSWGVKAVKKDLNSFKNKKSFPKSWAGLRDKELQKVSGVKDAVFCHRLLFLAVARSKIGAIKLAQLAIK